MRCEAWMFWQSHPQVDPKRLASTGQSGGATVTMMLAAVDDRLACAAVSSGNTENFACANFHPPGSTDDAEQNFIGAGPLGFDRWDLLWPIAPKPLLILTSGHDFFGTYSPNYEDNGLEEYARLEAAYRLLQTAGSFAAVRIAFAAWAFLRASAGDLPLAHALARRTAGRSIRNLRWRRSRIAICGRPNREA